MVTGPVNDLGMVVDNRLIVLVEQQSTNNPNMPLRMLLYVAREYEQELKKNDVRLYGSKEIKIFTPEFFVLYNGRKPLENWCYTKNLSESFLSSMSKVNLELVVTVIDVNSEQFKKKLKEHSTMSQYIEAVDTFNACHKNKDDLTLCVDNLIKNNILSDYLSTHTTEVIDMLIYDYDQEKELEYALKEGKEEGIKEGIKEGINKFIEVLRQQGMSEEEIEKMRELAENNGN
jgi:predicted transposase/invertase (TIGR01784 family)